ncbi:MAG: hypothetical protein R3D86_02265 [Emcibacteraceae bacterium]
MSKLLDHISKHLINAVFILMFSIFLSFNLALAQEKIKVRSGDHPTYSRVVFDWEKTVGYSAKLNSGKLEIEFNANAVPDFTSFLLVGPAYLKNPTYSVNNGKLNVTFQATNAERVRDFRSGTRIVIDVMGEGAPTPPSVLDRESVATVDKMPATEQAVVTEMQDQRQTVSSETKPDMENAGSLTVQGQNSENAFTIDYIWSEDTKAAAFIRANRLWVVFDKFTIADQSGLNSLLGGRVKSAEQLTNHSPTILIYSIDPGQSARMVKKTNGWELSLRTNSAVPQLPIEVGHQSVSNVGENIFLKADDLGNVINVEDPFIGDNLTIVTASQSSQGVMEENNYPEFNILKSAEGIALELIADDIFVSRHDTGISISGRNGLAVSRSSVPLLSGALPVALDTDKANEEQVKLLDFDTWAQGPLPDQEYMENRHELLYQLSTATDDEKNEARWNLAVYDLAHNNAAETIGILELMSQSEPGFIENPSFRAVLAISEIKMRRFDEAIELLSHKSLVAELDALLWRSLAYEEKGEYQKAMDDFKHGVDVLSLQTNDNRADFLFSAIRAANMLDDVEFMNTQINGMRTAQLNARQLTLLDYWRGQLAEKSGDDALASEFYDQVIATGVRYPAALAKLARINQQHRLQEIDAVHAIDGLEKLRFAWRGDNFELDLLKQLGELYVENGEYREGLATLKQAATYFPNSPATSDLTRKMGDIYKYLFLDGGADSMTPLKAMALFMEFRELTPLGADGDTMSRNLAARMVAVDLLDDAADLLEYQVQYRLQGVAQADIASDLAKIYIMNKEPDKALQILRSTRQTQLPDDIEFERRMIEIRALVENGSYEEAEVMLEGINSEVAEDLRSDIYWKMEDWDRVVSHGYKMLGNRWEDSLELNNKERKIVLRIAVALALEENTAGLERLRSQYLTHMDNGLFSNAFAMITEKDPKTGNNVLQLTQSIASVDQLETFMDSYRAEFEAPTNIN